MVEIVHRGIEEYLLGLTPARDPVLQEMERLGAERDFPLVGPLVGRLLYVLARAIGARRVLELGSGFGYSAYWFAQAVGEGGTVVCTETSRANAGRARDFFARAGLSARIDFRVGDALRIVKGLDGEFDVIFNDVDKEQYPEAFRTALPLLRSGGLFLSDNVLWFGQVLQAPPPDADTAGVQEMTHLLYETPGLYTTILPLRDGVSVSLKL